MYINRCAISGDNTHEFAQIKRKRPLTIDLFINLNYLRLDRSTLLNSGNLTGLENICNLCWPGCIPCYCFSMAVDGVCSTHRRQLSKDYGTCVVFMLYTRRKHRPGPPGFCKSILCLVPLPAHPVPGVSSGPQHSSGILK